MKYVDRANRCVNYAATKIALGVMNDPEIAEKYAKEYEVLKKHSYTKEQADEVFSRLGWSQVVSENFDDTGIDGVKLRVWDRGDGSIYHVVMYYEDASVFVVSADARVKDCGCRAVHHHHYRTRRRCDGAGEDILGDILDPFL